AHPANKRERWICDDRWSANTNSVRPRGSGDPGAANESLAMRPWIPACAGMSGEWADRCASSPAARGLDGGDVDLAHPHHRLERALGFLAARRQRLHQHARRDLPGDAPPVLAPAALAL